MSDSSIHVNVTQHGLWASFALITVNGVAYGRASEKERWLRRLRIDATDGSVIEVAGGPTGTSWEQFLGRTRHSIRVDGKEMAHIESRGVLGFQHWLVVEGASYHLLNEFYGRNRQLIRMVKPPRWNSQRPCDFEFLPIVPVAVSAIVSYWLWLNYVNSSGD